MVGPNSETERKRIGLVWAGRPTYRNDRNRSVKLEAFLPLLRLTDLDFYSLQVGDHAADIEEAGLLSDLIDLSPRLTDFSETAAALSQIDLLISDDTAAVHVAGALGRPVWALIPSAPDWRWGLEGDATAWYQSANSSDSPSPMIGKALSHGCRMRWRHRKREKGAGKVSPAPI